MSKELILAVVGLAILTSALFACRTSQRDVVDGALESPGGLLELAQLRQGDRKHVMGLGIFRGLFKEGLG